MSTTIHERVAHPVIVSLFYWMIPVAIIWLGINLSKKLFENNFDQSSSAEPYAP